MLRHVNVPVYGVFKAPKFPVSVPKETGEVEVKMMDSNAPLPDPSSTNLKALLAGKIPLQKVPTKIVGGDPMPFIDALEAGEESFQQPQQTQILPSQA